MGEPMSLPQVGVAALSDDDLIAEAKLRLETGDISQDDLGISSRYCADCGYPASDGSETSNVDFDELAAARSYMVQRNYREMLWCLEKALGDGFSGLSELTPEQLK